MELIIWEGDYGLSSIDSECLHVLAYCVLTKAPVTIKYGKSSMLYHKKYPLLLSGSLQLKNVSDIISFLRLHGFTLDYNVSLKQCTDVYAFSNIMSKRLREILYYVFWLDDVNYQGLTYMWYSKAMNFPFNHLYPRHCRKMAKRVLEASVPRKDDEEKDSIKNYIFSLAAETFSALSARLGNGTFFYGDRPSSLDTLVYAFLAPLLHIPFPSDDFTQLLKKWPTLVKYVDRFHKTVFPDVQYVCKYIKTPYTMKQMDDETQGSIFLPLIFACLFLVGAAYSRGLLDIRSLKRN